ncbi:RdRp, partial [Carnation necrotic fleck virus]
ENHLLTPSFLIIQNSALSVIRSQAIPPRRPSLQENIYSYEARNYNFLKCDRLSSPEVYGRAMARNLIDRCVNPEAFLKATENTIAFSKMSLLQWLNKREPSQIKSLQSELSRPLDLDTAIHYFKLMVKRDAKVKLDSTSLVKHSPAQNIMFHAKHVNALYSPCFDEFKNRLMSCLHSNIVFFTEMDNRQFARVVSGLISDYDDEYRIGEIDFSKFDKSQDIFVKEFEREIYSLFSFDAELLDLWMQGEYRAKATTLDGQLSFDVVNQRRSGASNTWIGNSLVTLGMLSLYYRVNDFKALFISGDDSLIYSETPITNHADAICIETGFETKFMTPSVPYLGSKPGVCCGHKTYVVPDPYKLMVKLGSVRKEVDDSELFEVYTSFKDLTKDFDDERVVRKLSLPLASKYGFDSVHCLPALHSIHCLNSNFKSFLKLYNRKSGWFTVKKLLPNLKRLIFQGKLNCAKVSHFFW